MRHTTKETIGIVLALAIVLSISIRCLFMGDDVERMEQETNCECTSELADEEDKE